MRAPLVILGSTITALAVARDAHAHGLEPVVVDTQEGVAHQCRWVRAEVLPADYDTSDIIKRVLRFSRADAALIATGDAWLRWIMSQREVLDRAFTVLHSTNASLSLCLNKQDFAAWCMANELSCPRSWLVNREPRPPQLQPPFLLRPAETLHGNSLRGTDLPKAVEVQDEQGLENWLARFRQAECDVLVTESLLGQPIVQYSVPFARGHGRCQSFVARKVRPAPDRCAVGTCVELSPEPEVESLARRAADGLDYFGVGEAEILRSERTGRGFLIEINARPWLQYALAPASRHDFLGLLLRLDDPSVQPTKRGHCWIDLQSDLFGAFSSSVGEVRHGDLGLPTYLASLARVNVFARFNWRDPAPAFWRPRDAPRSGNREVSKSST